MSMPNGHPPAREIPLPGSAAGTGGVTRGVPSAGERALTDWYSPEFRGPKSRLVDDLAYKAIWSARAFTERETLFRNWERRLQRSILEHSRGGSAAVREVPHFSVEEADAATVRRLIKNHVPFVVDGYLKHTKAVREWSLDSLKERCGAAPIHSLNDGLRGEADRNPWYRRQTFSRMTLSDIVDAVRRGERAYVSGVGAIFKHHPELREEAGFAEVERFSGFRMARADMFLGSTQNKSYFHCAMAATLFLQIHGRKRWVLAHARHTKWMYPGVGFGRLVMGSPVVSSRPDVTDDFPLFGRIPKFTVHLSPGDLYYNPSWIWHEVSNLGETIGIAVRIVPRVRTPNPFFDFLMFTSPIFLKNLPKMVKDRLRGDLASFAFDDSMVSEVFPHG